MGWEKTMQNKGQASERRTDLKGKLNAPPSAPMRRGAARRCPSLNILWNLVCHGNHLPAIVPDHGRMVGFNSGEQGSDSK